MKKKLIYVIIIIACFIPTLIAIKSYFNAQNQPAVARTAQSIKIEDINGESTLLTKKADGDEADQVINYFLSTNSNAMKITSLPESLKNETPYCVTVSTAVKDEVYQYYFSTSPELCYMVSPDGTAYQITQDDAKAFLGMPYAASLYTSSVHPVMTLSNVETPKAYQAEWYFKDFEGNYVTADVTDDITESNQKYDIIGGITVAYNVEPDTCRIQVTDTSDTLVFDDINSNISNFNATASGTYTVLITSEWYQDSERDYYGKYLYKFSVNLTESAKFYILKNEVEQGSFVAVVAEKAADASLISATCEPAIESDIVFHKDGDSSYAFLPIPLNADPGDYEFKFTYGGSTQSVFIKVVERVRTDSSTQVSEDVLANCFSEGARNEFDTLVKELAAESSDTRLYDGYFAEGPTQGTLTRGFGRTVVINNDGSKTYVNTGVDYNQGQGLDVVACNAGTVVYAGSTGFTGKVVVIEHGYGLKTWYWNLDSVSVEKGASVARGDTIGTSGNTGFRDDTIGVHIAMSVNDVFVCPYDTWADGDGGIIMRGVYEPE